MKKSLFVSVIFLFGAIAAFAQVDTAWVRRYDGPGNYVDEAFALAVDTSSNVYVTGYTFGIGTEFDYTTIKYYEDGDTAWVRRYNGPGNYNDYAFALAVDDSGNVYITGESDGSGTDRDYATIKYYSNGDTAWVRRYNGPGNYMDGAFALAVDASSNVYVTGYISVSVTDIDYATIKYNSNGDTAWVKRYNGPGEGIDYAVALAVDGSGNVYVTGMSDATGTENYDYATIKYNSNGDTAWVRRYNGPGNDYDKASALAVDGFGNVYVTGYSDGSGTSLDYTTIKYNSNGDTTWVRRYNGPGNERDYAYALAVDGSGNVYITGYSDGSGTDIDYATIKYYSNGDTAWVRRYNGPADSSDKAYALAVDGSGNVYVTGRSYGSGTDYDYATVKYNSAGDTVWVMRYDWLGSIELAYALAVDGSGNVYVTGNSFSGGETFTDYATIKYVQGEVFAEEHNGESRVHSFALFQNYPNPFNQNTKIKFTLANSGYVSLTVYDILGRKIKTLVSEYLAPGHKSVLWDGKDNAGGEVSSGIYFYQLKIGDLSLTRKLVLLK